MNSDGYIDFLNALCRLYSKTDAHNLSLYDQNGWVIQGDLTQSILKISGFINCFFLPMNLHFCLVHVHVYDTRC